MIKIIFVRVLLIRFDKSHNFLVAVLLYRNLVSIMLKYKVSLTQLLKE